MTRIAATLALLGGCWFVQPALALWFASTNLVPNLDEGILEYVDAWAKDQRVGFMHGMGATPVAPHWILTAGHLQNQMIFDFKQGSHGNGSYHIVETVPHPNYPRVDLRLYRVKEILPDYSVIAKKHAASNEVLTMYGRGKEAPVNPVVHEGRVIGRALEKWESGKEGLRAGPITNHSYFAVKELAFLKWYLGDGPATAYSDSGHPVFRGNDLAGILVTAPVQVSFRFGQSGPCTNFAFIFDDRDISSCSTPPGDTRASTVAVDVTAYLPWIYGHISPAIRLCARKEITVEGWTNWAARGARSYETKTPVEISARNAAPPEIYQSIFYHRRGPIEFAQADLLRTEKYTVRLHFSGIYFNKAGEVEQNISVNGKVAAERFDPFVSPGGANKASVLAIRDVVPDAENRITVNLTPSARNKATSISAIEMLLQLD